MNAYEKVHALSRNNRVLQSISQILEWDQETMMPPAAAPQRGEQLKMLAGMVHKARTGKPFADALSKIIDLKTGKSKGKLTPQQARAATLWLRDYKKEKSLPTKFVEDYAHLTSQALEAWRHARQENAFSHFAPFLDKIVTMNRKKADLLGYEEHPYDALLDLYEPDMTTKEVEKVFKPLQKSLTGLLKKIQAKTQVKDQFLKGNFPEEKQIAFAHTLLEAIGYDKNKGRLDISTHPFSSSSHPNDSRITTRVHQDFVISNISVVLHEGGHSLYEMGLPQEHYGSPLGQALSLGMHESQSRWWETRIGHSKAFWEHYLPHLKKIFKSLDKVNVDQFYKGINKVEPSLIRVEADEVTYSLHVILRFEIEKALIEGTLAIRDVPDFWNAKMKELLFITPPSNREGCLQDIHWSMGAMGYFPTYTLGNLYASHLFLGFEKKHRDWAARVAQGEFNFIREWLHTNVYQHGRALTSKELLKKATGKEFSANAFINYLEHKYKDIYQL